MRLTDQALLGVRDGTLRFDDFARGARPEFALLAAKMLARFPGLYAVEVDDLVQEMLLSAHRRIGTWQPEFGYPISKYVVWNACSRARKLCKRQLALLQVVSLMPVPYKGQDVETVEPLQELEVEVVQTLRDLPTNDRQVAVMNSVFDTQCVDRSLAELLADPATRRMFAGDRETVRRGVYRTVTRLTKRAQQLAR